MRRSRAWQQIAVVTVKVQSRFIEAKCLEAQLITRGPAPAIAMRTMKLLQSVVGLSSHEAVPISVACLSRPCLLVGNFCWAVETRTFSALRR
jgi:hypothetical protein